ncbi:hypothetical protein IQ07DRAFT_585387 [Pyrenochaeta sp. DS3sAY3a]|nr:hypothetical protein IQ07DRAFT_585387 [Pyrenochaeta sp. DS3sAY3a]
MPVAGWLHLLLVILILMLAGGACRIVPTADPTQRLHLARHPVTATLCPNVPYKEFLG